LTEDAEFMKQYWFGVHCESEWRPGSSWRMVHSDGSVSDAGEIVEAERPTRLVIRWRHQRNPELAAEGDSLCTMELEPTGSAVKLSIIHTIERDPSKRLRNEIATRSSFNAGARLRKGFLKCPTFFTALATLPSQTGIRLSRMVPTRIVIS
jgi:uncharacterized protein YndB with AHSA1/START domain